MNGANIGALRFRVTLEAPIDAPDGAGGFSRSFTPVANLWARIALSSAREDFIEQRAEQATNHVVTIRWRNDVTKDMRVLHRGRKLRIQSVFDPDERRRFLICQCEEIT
ncbi:phage head closure protein [Methylocystis sp. B8]|uniref:phage head closure protein n=1 Tax=Methylocystis sp. B8 TaxID=544938 RepID=UPI0010FD5BC4|nr:phage head closure protein [Methylocystis sp. B8]TLG78591.1 head-tail adaptor protein [Methylocystis sp. B8]